MSMRMSVVTAVLVLCALVAPTTSSAGKRTAIAGITLETPAGWKVTKLPDGGGSLKNREGDIVCRVFASEASTDAKAWFDEAWSSIATVHTKVDGAPAEETPTKSGLVGRMGVGVMTDVQGGSHVLLFAVISDGKRVAPILIEFASQDALARASDLVTAIDTIQLGRSAEPKTKFARGGWRYPLTGNAPVLGAPPSTVPVRPTTTAPPAAPATTQPFLGTWATGSSSSNSRGDISYGSRQARYDFKPNGTYTFHAELWGGSFNSNWRYVIDESGEWSASGDQLTLAPKSASGIVRDLQGKVAKAAAAIALEKATYKVSTAYFSGIGETQLVLSTSKPTQRDGAYASNSTYPNSYLLSSTYKPAFRHAP